ncbi:MULTISPECIES: carbohydrate ABC transporter permease [Ensifer]|jgi:ABC-type sugar transport system permease subunit|uniref:carbohydrate ABC transporter permease n=1 Tax=Ensifer TaxID=106591 RepID=UPI00071503EF|nr:MULTISPECIES: sugar ABC transporter permease [Ensifer]OWZ91181.1 ABC transporter permease [Sinorhizobium sp. LM21]KQX25837.1 ABC transporter permease [Ensifer sp. Root423]KQX54829.1 ABC transporter permease [Ensifer sp. Root1298]KQX89203.1 ABC transporter permease [Ensifer sp. Root1312]KRC25014.1 ABC transporter permease [Ensifer sp. Root74]
MPHRAFFAFIMPSLLAMLLFIALPIISVAVQSLYVQHERVVTEVETCVPFGGCTKEMRVDAEATTKLRHDEPLGRFNGFGTYLDRNHLAISEVGAILSENAGFTDAVSRIYNLPFYRALAFTLTYTFVVTPLAMVLGFCIALGVNAIPPFYKGPVIFFSLLPMIVTPLVGALIVYWMASSQGILGATLQSIFNDPTLSLKSSAVLTWITLLVYGIWHNAPFSFVVFYAGLQTVPHDTIESAMIDGANRWERIRFVVIPHLMPLATFVGLVQLMDNFRVFEPIVGFSAEANATSLSWSIFNDLRGQVDQLFGSAAATSMLTIAGVVILLSPVLVRTWREFNRR